MAFSLAVLLNSENVPTKNLMTTTALVVILFTVFIQVHNFFAFLILLVFIIRVLSIKKIVKIQYFAYCIL